MELRQLEAFVAVVDRGSFSAAAQHLRVVQSAVSKTIRELETDLRTRLLERSSGSRAITLTLQGERLLPEARDLLARARAARELATAGAGALSGSLDIGVMTILGPVSLPELLGRFAAIAPDVAVRIHTRPRGSADLLQGVSTGEFDLALLAPSASVPADVRVSQLGAVPLRLLVPAEHRLAAETSVSLAEVADERWIDCPPGYGSRAITDAAFARLGLHRFIALEFNEIRQLPEMVSAGLGIGFYPGEDRLPPRVVSLDVAQADAPQLNIQLAVREGPQRPTVAALLDALHGLLP